MTRPSFSIEVPGSYTTRTTTAPSVTTLVPDASSASEQVTGTSRRKPEGWIPPTSYVFERSKLVRHDGKLHLADGYEVYYPHPSYEIWADGVVGGGAEGVDSQNIFDSMYYPQGVPSDFVDRALTSARIKMKSGDVNLAVAFAERKRTGKLCNDTALQLVNSVRQLRRGNFRGAARELGITNPRKPVASSVPSRWLELQYGWKPLLSDVYGSAEALARRRGEDWIVTAKSAITEPIERSYHSPPYGFNVGVGKVTGMRGCFVRIDAIPQNDLLMSFASLGITNPALLAWELLPFSFVADWFIPVGKFLESIDAMLGYGPSWTSTTRIERFECRHKLHSSERRNYFGSFTKWTSEGRAYSQYIRLDRDAAVGVPIPNPYIKDPRSLGHMANALSLLSQVFGGRK